MSTVLSDDAVAANCSQRLTSATHRNSITHSMDSGQLSDLSSDNEQCSKSSEKHADDYAASSTTTTTTSKITSPKRQHRKNRKPLDRRESIDSCHTSSSVSCADPQCTRDHSQLSLMCQGQWESSKEAAKTGPKFEYDEGTLARRQKQIDYGKSTIGYKLYKTQVPK